MAKTKFKEFEFYSSLTDKKYYTKTNSQGTLFIFESATNKEVPNFASPCKKHIVRQALKDLNISYSNDWCLYRLTRLLQKSICG